MLEQPKCLAIIQARMGSTRFPGKILIPLQGHPMLWHIVQRVQTATTVHETVVATSDQIEDQPVVDFCNNANISVFQGNEHDVLDRFYQVAKYYQGDIIVRITGDCPLIDPSVIDKIVNVYQQGCWDYVSNVLVYSYPDGLDVEVFGFQALGRARKEARLPSEREHVTPYLRNSERFRIRNVFYDGVLPCVPTLHWSVDFPIDKLFIDAVYQELFVPEAACFTFADILQLLEIKPHLLDLLGGNMMNERYYKTLYEQADSKAHPKLNLEKNMCHFERAKAVIPGCAQTFSKGYTQYVQGSSPLFLAKGAGAKVWDLDGNEYIDYVQGLLPNILGYSHDEVNNAVIHQISQGHSFSLPHPLEVELAERLIDIIPCAEMIRYMKNGSDATSAAIRIARAATGRQRIACYGYHGWHDWYIGSTTRNLGVPEAVQQLTHPFVYNDLTSLRQLLETYPHEFAAVIMEPVNFVEPVPGYLATVKELAHQHGAVLIFDEICTGFHLGLGGAQKKYGVIPDLACFGKALGNGYPISFVAGSKSLMSWFEKVFVSFTFAGDVSAMAAAMKVLDILEHTDTLARMQAYGGQLQDGFNSFAKYSGLTERFECIGFPSWTMIRFKDPQGQNGLLERSLFQQEAAKRGILILAGHNMTGAHNELTTEKTLHVYAEIFKNLADWLSTENPQQYLEGNVSEPVFKVR